MNLIKNFNVSLAEIYNRLFNPKGEYISANVLPYITPTVQLKPHSNIVRHGSSTTTGNSTIFTTPTDKDFYLTGAFLSGTADVTADNTNFTLAATVDGTSRQVIILAKQTTTVYEGHDYCAFPFPIKVDRGTNIISSTTFTVGTTGRTACIMGFTQEVTKSN